MSVRIDGMAALRRTLVEVTTEGRAIAAREVMRSTLNIQAGAKKRAPVDTGRLRNSIATEIERDGLTGVVGTNVEYAPFVEWGTSKMPAQPYLLPAHEEEVPHFLRRLRDALAKIGGRVIRVDRG